MERSHIEQAKFWLEGGQHIARSTSEKREKWSVAVAMLVHAIIKANDALVYKFINMTPRRHDDARKLFEDLKRKSLIKPEHTLFDQVIQEAINNKAKAEYRIAFFSKSDYENLERKTVKFIRMAEEYL